MTWAIFPRNSNLRAVGELLTTGSERVVAIVGGALLEEAVEQTLRERLLNDPSLVDSLLRVDGALGNMGPQIDLLRLLGAFDERARMAMKGIARVRNFFAHRLDASFDSPDAVKAIKQLTLHENRTYYPHALFGSDSTEAIEPINSKRDQFVANLKLALIFLMRDRVGKEAYTNRLLTEAELRDKFPNR